MITVDDLVAQRDPKADPRLGDTFVEGGGQSFTINAWGRRLGEHEVTRAESGRVITWWCRLDNHTLGDKRGDAATHVRIVEHKPVKVPVIGGGTKMIDVPGAKWLPWEKVDARIQASARADAHDAVCWWQQYRDQGAVDAHKRTKSSPMTIVMPWGVLVREEPSFRWRLYFNAGDLKFGPFRSFPEARVYGLALHHIHSDRGLHRALDPGYAGKDGSL
ncbi:MAG: hypothetical protein HRU14_17350 [Planctomycetes bacterium]|nr:hypothetical protein [Planctomycetota bacterium]